MSFRLKTLKNPNKNQLQTIINQFELSDNMDSTCYEDGKSEGIEKQFLENIILRV